MVLPPEFYFPFLNYKIWPGNCQGDADFTNALLTLKRLGRESEAPPAFRGNSFCHRLGALAWGGHCPPISKSRRGIYAATRGHPFKGGALPDPSFAAFTLLPAQKLCFLSGKGL